jgi:AcrR family transcriptional regulator
MSTTTALADTQIRRPRLDQSRQSRAALVAAATALLARDGAAAVTHRAVARHAGAAHGSVSYHFGTTDELLDHACLLELQAISRQLWELLNRPTDGPARSVAQQLTARADEVLLPDDRRARLLLEIRLRPASRPRIAEAIDQLREDAQTVIARLSDDAGRAPDPEDGRRLLCVLDSHLLDRCSGSPQGDARSRLGDHINQMFGA